MFFKFSMKLWAKILKSELPKITCDKRPSAVYHNFKCKKKKQISPNLEIYNNS